MSGTNFFNGLEEVFIIAEAGVNHNGNLNLAYKLIDEAKNAGANAVKFQTSIPEKSMSKYVQVVEYQEKNIGEKKTMLEMAKNLALSFEDFIMIKKYCDDKGILFLSTPFHIEAAEFLNKLVPIFKISSGEIVNKQMIEYISNTKKPAIISTGMCGLSEIEKCIDYFMKYNNDNIALLHCTTDYPCPYEDVNLKAMNTLREAFKLPVGYSDHTLGIEVPVAAVAMGARIIEKHFTLDKNMIGPDHKASLEPHELSKMVKSIRNIEKALGNGIKKPNQSELKIKDKVRKSLTALRDIKKGEKVDENNTTFKKPGYGISAEMFEIVKGKKLIKDIKEDETITWDYLIE